MAFDLHKRDGDDSAPKPSAPVSGGTGGGGRLLPGAVALALVAAAGWYFFGRDAGTPPGAPVDRPSAGPSADSGVPGQSSAPPVEESSRLAAQGGGSSAQDAPAPSVEGTGTQANPKAPVDPPKGGGVGGSTTSTGDLPSASVPGRQNGPAKPVPSMAVLFPAGSSAVPSADDALVARILARAAEGAVVKINGYASSEGDLQLNTVLSERRAAAFKAYLVTKGASAERLVASGRGIVDPVASNDTEAGRAKNRRVEVVL